MRFSCRSDSSWLYFRHQYVTSWYSVFHSLQEGEEIRGRLLNGNIHICFDVNVICRDRPLSMNLLLTDQTNHILSCFRDFLYQVMRYLEMSGRTEVLNKRLDMLRELLDVLQQQMENAHSVKLEWIVIWLIVIEVVLQVFAIGGQSMGWSSLPA